MRKMLLIALLIIVVQHARAQDTAFVLQKSIPGRVTMMAADNLGYLYLLNVSNQLKKLSPSGDSVAVFNEVKKSGRATLIDVSNPLRVLLYYPDFATVVVLDRLLAVRNTIDLRRQHILQVRAVAQSYDNKIWLYDEYESKLKKIDEDGKLLSETADFRLLLGEAIAPQLIFEQDRLVYLYDPAKGIFAFDYYGTLKTRIPVTGWQNVQASGKYIYGSAGNKLFRYDMSTLLTREWDIPPALAGSLSFTFTSSGLYALKKEAVEIYAWH